MVVKTEVCSYSGFRIYPGHGIKYVRGDSKSFLFINRKSKSYFHQKFNPRKIAWTLLYRRMHKKGTLEDTQKKTKRKVSKGAPKAVVGASLELIKQKRNQKPEVRAAAREAALREIKERAKAKQVGALHLVAVLCHALCIGACAAERMHGCAADPSMLRNASMHA